jgi:phage replication O-like protein O
MSFSLPNYTQVPNTFLDHMLPFLKEGELKVLLVIIRKTMGYHKYRDIISLTQLEKFTGMTRSNILYAVRKLVSKGVISKEVSGSNGKQSTHYELVIVQDSNNYRGVLKDEIGGSNKILWGVSIEERGGVSINHTQNKDLNKTINKKGNDLDDVRSLPFKEEKEVNENGTKFPLKKEQKEFFEELKSLNLDTDDRTLTILIRTAFKEGKVEGLKNAISHMKAEIKKGTIFKKPKIAMFRTLLLGKISPITERAKKNKLKAEEIKSHYKWNTLQIHNKFVYCEKTHKEIPLDMEIKTFCEKLKDLYLLNK